MIRYVIAMAAALLCFGFAGTVAAHSYEIDGLHVGHPWARATPPAAPAAAVYFSIASEGVTDQLVGVSTPVAERAEMHRTVKKDGMAEMVHVDRVAIESNAGIEFKPGGYHVMLMGLKAPLVEGDRFPLTLHFDKAGALEVEVAVEALIKTDAKDDHAHH